MTAGNSDIRGVIQRYLKTPSASWSIGSFGAIAEFHRCADEPLALDAFDLLTVATDRGAIRITLHDRIVPIAYETLSGHQGRWQHGVAFCLPRSRGTGNARSFVADLGPDRDAIHERDRGAILFDVGLSARNVDFCVRTDNDELIALLRYEVGRSLLAPGSRAMAAIVEAGPHRVAVSRLGRIEVYQPIGREKTPEGPHTHVLPKLLKSGRTHSATVPVPGGHLPCLSLYPANPLAHAGGASPTFDASTHAGFQAVLAAWGPSLYCREKQRALQAFLAGIDPIGYAPHGSRLGRTALRIALRQLRFLAPDDDSVVASWVERFDRPLMPTSASPPVTGPGLAADAGSPPAGPTAS
jgi:hypothetical protein